MLSKPCLAGGNATGRFESLLGCVACLTSATSLPPVRAKWFAQKSAMCKMLAQTKLQANRWSADAALAALSSRSASLSWVVLACSTDVLEMRHSTVQTEFRHHSAGQVWRHEADLHAAP